MFQVFFAARYPRDSYMRLTRGRKLWQITFPSKTNQTKPHNKHCRTFHKEQHPLSDNLTSWAGTGILLPHCLPPAYIGEKGKEELICFNIYSTQRFAFHWLDSIKQRKFSLLLRGAVTAQELLSVQLSLHIPSKPSSLSTE